MIRRSFEESGLGKAPFQFVGMHINPSKSLIETNPEAWNEACRNSPKLTHGGTWACAHCGTSITNAFIIKSSDGETSAVGETCITKIVKSNEKDAIKAGFTQIEKEVKNLKRKAAQQKRDEKYKRLWDEFTNLVIEPSFNAYLVSQPHSRTWLAEKGLTLLDDLKTGMSYVSLREEILEKTKRIKTEFEATKEN